MVTTAEIAKEAFDAVSAEITDAIYNAVITRTAQGAYNVTTDTYATTQTTHNGRVVEITAWLGQRSPLPDLFPDFVVGRNNKIFMGEGFDILPQQNDTVQIKGVDYHIERVADTMLTATIPYFVVR